MNDSQKESYLENTVSKQNESKIVWPNATILARSAAEQVKKENKMDERLFCNVKGNVRQNNKESMPDLIYRTVSRGEERWAKNVKIW